MIEYDKLQKSLRHLQLQFENYRTFDSSQPKLLQEAVAESVIQRFEICYDCMFLPAPKKNSRSSASRKLSMKAICRSVSICSTGANCPKISEITSKPGIWF